MSGQPRLQLLVDLSVLVRHDARSGIQRAARGVLQALYQKPPAGYRVRPVYDAGGYYAYAGLDAAGALAGPQADDAPIRVTAGDIFFGLDVCPEHIPKNQALLASLKAHGVKIYFIVHDLLPAIHPEWFFAGAQAWFGNWLNSVAQLADGLLCSSRATADTLLAWLEECPPRRDSELQLGCCHLGADLQASQPSTGISEADAALLQHLTQRPTILMVGTLEPRKMHAQAAAAFDLLWQRGRDVNLVIVGKPGWLLEHLTVRLRAHPEQGKRLFWLEQASDDMLLRLYQQCSALLSASSAEGFGLPLIEAAQHKVPLIVRDIPVFREVAGEHAFFFTADTDAELADALVAWLDLDARGLAPASHGMHWLSWAESTEGMLRVMTEQRWYKMAPTALA